MELSILVAKIVAIMYVSLGISVLSGQMDFKEMYKSFQNSSGLTLMSGIFIVVLGALLINEHNIWEANWTVVVTIIGWAMLIKGIIFLVAPKAFMKMGEKMLPKNSKCMGILVIAIGIILGYFGFMS